MQGLLYAASDSHEKGLATLRSAIASCYPVGTSVDDSRLSRIFEQNSIPTGGLCLRSNVVDAYLDDSCITLYCDSAWSPMYEAYLSLAEHFGVSSELQAEEPGSNVYINTDMNGTYLPTHYKACLAEHPEDGSLDSLFAAVDGDTDLYFESEEELLQWFKECGGISADSAQDLQNILTDGNVSIHKFVNPYK